jgi:PAS domain S-box-containing protein
MQGRFLPQLLAALVLIVSLVVTYGVWDNANQDARNDLQTSFDFRAREISQRVEQRMATYEQVLRGAQAFWLGHPAATRDDFRLYVARLRLEEHFPGIQGLAISQIVPKEQKHKHIAAMRAQGFPDYVIHPEAEREVYTSITQIEPFVGLNLRAHGFDMFSEPVRRVAMERARDSGKAALSGMVTLVQEVGENVQAGFLMYLPLFERGMPIDSMEHRRAGILGWAYAPFRMNDLMAGLGGERSSDLRVRIYDGGAMSDDRKLYDSAAGSGVTGLREPFLNATRRIEIAGHPWTLAISSAPSLEARLGGERPKFIAVAGIGMSALLALLVWLLATGRKRAIALAMQMTDELRASEFRWKHALEGAGDGVWDWNNQTNDVIYSAQWKAMLGYADHEIQNGFAQWEKLAHPEDRQRVVIALDDYISGRKPAYVTEHRLRCKDGSWKWVLGRGMVVRRAADGTALRTIGTHTDITRIKQNEEALRESNARLASERQHMKVILENSHDAFIAIGANEGITDWNVQAERTFGWTAEEAIGKSLADLIIPEDQREAHRAGFRRFVVTGTGPVINQRIEVAALQRSGKLIPVELAIAAVRHGAAYTANAFIRDISERKEAQRLEVERLRSLEEARGALLHSQKLEAVGKLTGGVAHDFNNVLQIIAGNLQLLQILFAGNEQAQKRLNSALKGVDRGAKLSSQLLAFARRQPLQPVVVNMGRMIKNLEDLMRQALGATITTDMIIADGLWNTLVDRNQLENVILNLAINSRDAMAGSGRLVIELSNTVLDDDYVSSYPDLAAGEYALLAISDTGAGMTPEVIEQAFEPFFTTKPEGEGTGLGLSMAYGFVKQSGGHIQIYSEVGHGTTVRIYLPRSSEVEVAAPASSSDTLTGGNETILVVEDDVNVQGTVVSMLTELGYQVIHANDGESALNIVKSGVAIDLLFSDVVMPGRLRGPDLAKEAKAIIPDLAVLFTSGYTQNAMGQEGRLDPDVNLLSKPYRREQLARKVRQLLGEKG